MNVHRLFTWADRVLKLSSVGGAKAGSMVAKLRACLDQLPACKALMKRFRQDASGLLKGRKFSNKTVSLTPLGRSVSPSLRRWRRPRCAKSFGPISTWS